MCNNACLYVQLYMYDIVYMYLGIMAIHIARYKKLAKALKYVRKWVGLLSLKLTPEKEPGMSGGELGLRPLHLGIIMSSSVWLHRKQSIKSI